MVGSFFGQNQDIADPELCNHSKPTALSSFVLVFGGCLIFLVVLLDTWDRLLLLLPPSPFSPPPLPLIRYVDPADFLSRDHWSLLLAFH
jgi:hypothetical protein